MSPVPTSPTWPATPAKAIGALALVVAIAACGSAATAAPTVTPAPAATASPAGAASPTLIATATPEVTAPPSPTASPAATGPASTPLLVDPFTSAGISEVVNTVAHAADESKYVTRISAISHTAVYVVFALKPGTVGKVTMVMTLGGVNVADPLTIDYQTKNSWGDFKINFPSGGMPLGDYQATMTYEPTGASVTVFFTVD